MRIYQAEDRDTFLQFTEQKEGMSLIDWEILRYNSIKLMVGETFSWRFSNKIKGKARLLKYSGLLTPVLEIKEEMK